MELHHKLRRDPNWHPSACNICGQLGHQAANCTNGTINWRQIYGDDAFVLREPVYWSEIQKKRKQKQVDFADLERRAREYAAMKAQSSGINYNEMTQQAQAMLDKKLGTAQAPVIKQEPGTESELPPGWATATDSNGKVYYWHKKTQKTQWDRPTADTPIN